MSLNTLITLRPVADADIPVFFAQQLDPQANWMAAFTAPDPSDRAAFEAHWIKIRADAQILIRTILVGESVAGYVASFERWGAYEVTYWLGKEFWGRGCATAALRAFIPLVPQRPLTARAAKDHAASLRVLAKCGFKVEREERGFADARGAEIAELVLVYAPEAE